jgi:taurine dioxygenase
VHIIKLTSHCGAEIRDLDLSKSLEPHAISAVRQALVHHGVVFFRDQQLTPQQHLEFAAHFGPVETNRFFTPVAGHPQIAEVRKEPDQVQNIGDAWHTDCSYDPFPAIAQVLYARELPDVGGDTLWASMYAAYEALSDGLKATLQTLQAVHSSSRVYGAGGRTSKKGRADLTHDDRIAPDVLHPVVLTHPESGRRALYVNPVFTVRFEGWSEEESAPLLNWLYQHAQRPEFQCRFRWRTGSMAMWDNRCTWHYAANDYGGQRRLMHRITIQHPHCATRSPAQPEAARSAATS